MRDHPQYDGNEQPEQRASNEIPEGPDSSGVDLADRLDLDACLVSIVLTTLLFALASNVNSMSTRNVATTFLG